MLDSNFEDLEARLVGQMVEGKDVHLERAVIDTGKPADKITKAERARAKSKNFFELYSFRGNLKPIGSIL